MKLKMENFRNYGSAELEFGKMNLIGGPSGAGKTSIKTALCYALTGINIFSSDTNGLIKNQKNQAMVSIKDGFLEIERRLKPGSNEVRLNGSKISNKAMEEELVNKLGVNFENLHMMFDSGKFLNLSANEQKDYLYRISGIEINVDTLQNYCKEPLLPKAIDILKGLFEDDQISPAQLDAAYKTFLETRKNMRKEFAEVDNKIKGFGGKDVPADEATILKNISEIDAKLEKLGTEKSKHQVELGASNERKRRIEALEKQILTLDQQIKAIELKIDPNVDFGEAQMDLLGYVQTVAKLEEQEKELLEKLNLLRGEVKANQEIIVRLDAPCCPLSDQLTCTADRGFLQKTLETAVAEKEKEIDSLSVQYKSVETDLRIHKSAKTRLEEQLALEVTRSDVAKKKTAAELELHEIPAVNPTLAVKVEEIDQNVIELNKERKNFSLSAENIHTLAQLNKQKGELEGELAAYEMLVQEFSPKGVKQEILKKVLDKVASFGTTALNKLMPGNEIHFEFEDGFDIYITDKYSKSDRSINDLSTGERLRLSIVFQYIFSNITGAKVLFVDDLNFVDATNRLSIFQLLKEISGNFYQMFVSITEDDMYQMQSYQSELNADRAYFVMSGDIEEL